MNRGALGRADLIRWADCLGEDRLCRLAEGLGYKEQEAIKAWVSLPSPLGAINGMAKVGAPVQDTGAPRHRYYCLVGRRQIAPPPTEPPPKPAPEPEPPIAPLGPPPPLAPWPRLWPFLRAALGDLAERNRIDLPRLVAACARVRPPRRLPRLKGQRWAPQGQLILDLHPRLYPFWEDFNAIKSVLPRLRGAAGLEILRMDQGPDGPVQTWGGRGWGPQHPYTPPAPDIPLVIAGDLGCLGNAAQRQAWVRLGRRLAGAGSGRLPVALTPCPPRWWDPVLAGLYYPVALDRAAHYPPGPAGPRPWPSQAVDLGQAVRRDPGARRLLTLLSPCIAIRPALLRHLRHRLPAGLADAGSEAAAWLHPAWVAGDFALHPGDPAEVGALRQAFSTTGTEAERQLAWDLVRAEQGEGSTVSDRMEERVLYAAIHGRTDPQAEAFLDRVADALGQALGAQDSERARFLTAWVNRRSGRMHPDAWRHSPSSEVLWLKANPRAEIEGATLPPGYDIHRALTAQGRPERPQFWRLVQRGEWLEIEVFPSPEASFASGSPVVEKFPTHRPVAQARQIRLGARDLSLPLEGGARLPLSETGWHIHTDFEDLLIEPMERPPWAHTLGRDQDGLFVGFDDGYGDRRAYWCSPVRGHPDWLRAKPPVLPIADIMSDIERGFFLDEAQLRTFRAQGLFPPHTAESAKVDDHGLRLELTVRGVAVVLRWIWPGRFLMGSPITEKGRYDDERQYEVILSRGFWLAETACTQALWQAVMGENPSYRKGPQRPVQDVSWEDVQGFLARLNANAPSFKFRLPTEAEWEYACRAGTDTAYSFGDAFDPKLANNGGKTVDVHSLPPNPWGLYEMHGNVEEWCQDWFGDYPTSPVVDPGGPCAGEGRVLRGGSWINVARALRSACRHRGGPSLRRRIIGFRLALGPKLRPEGQARKAGAGLDNPRKERPVGSGRRGRSGPAGSGAR